MSATAALRVPVPAGDGGTPPRHLEIVPTRAQRRARPRLYAALVAVGGIMLILLAQLMMSIVLAEGAYRIADLQTDKRDLGRETRAAQESLSQLGSTQSLTANAALLGMVSSGNPMFLDVASGAALGNASATDASPVGSAGNLVGNALVDGTTTVRGEGVTGDMQQTAVLTGGGSPADLMLTPVTAPGSVAADGGAHGRIPSPTMR